MTATVKKGAIFLGSLHRCSDGVSDIRYWCSHCKRYHIHGAAGAGMGDITHRASHCWKPESPHYGKNVTIIITEVEH